jgi:hypothetical protein
MQAVFVIALIIAIPLILFPAAFVWYMNIGGIYTAIREARRKRAAQARNTEETASIKSKIHQIQ